MLVWRSGATVLARIGVMKALNRCRAGVQSRPQIIAANASSRGNSDLDWGTDLIVRLAANAVAMYGRAFRTLAWDIHEIRHRPPYADPEKAAPNPRNRQLGRANSRPHPHREDVRDVRHRPPASNSSRDSEDGKSPWRCHWRPGACHFLPIRCT